MIRMAATDRSYSEVPINPENSGYGEQSTIQDSTTPEGNYSYSIPQESPLSNVFVGYPRDTEDTLNNSEEMERRRTKRFQLKIDRLDDKVWRLYHAVVGRGGPGEEPEVSNCAREPEVVRKSPGNRRFIEKALITPTPFDSKTSWDDYQVQFELISELNRWTTKAMAINLAASLSGCSQALLWDLDDMSTKDYLSHLHYDLEMVGKQNCIEPS